MAIGATTAIILDQRYKKNSGLYSVKIRVTHNREQRYYPTGEDMTPEVFNGVMYSKKPRQEEKRLRDQLQDFENKAKDIIKGMPFFDFATFDKLYTQKRNLTGGIDHYFEQYVKELTKEGQINTAESYSVAITSLQKFKPKLKPRDITVQFLKDYQKYMTDFEDKENGKEKNSITTVGIYLRSLRSIINKYKLIPTELYPFGKGKYEIPTSKNIKKALNKVDIAKLYNYKAPLGHELQEKARDLWFFLYFGNGMNVKDMCFMRYSDIQGKYLYFHRQKTIRTKQVQEQITVSYTDDLKRIVKAWGNKSIDRSGYIFPFLTKGMTDKQIREKVKDVSKWINKYMALTVKDLGIEKKVTTYTARHSMATMLKKGGVATNVIQDFFKHGSMATTQRYLDSIEDDELHNIAGKLSDFKDKAG